MSNFKLVASTKVDGIIPVNKFVSELTGLTVITAAVEGPIVSGHLLLLTEAHDDDGVPHTLEHLIFLGSDQYPYKGVLDLLANRCLASGTNAWTKRNSTCYTLKTAGSDGFLALLPIYLDHILFPTLSDSGFMTEVHHINAAGEDSGVVYCEMQAIENTSELRACYKLYQKLYAGSGYCSETGGVLENLRTSTTNEKIKKFHSENYRPENLTIIVTGQMDNDELFAALAPFEQIIVEKCPKIDFVKPWQTPVAPLTESFDLQIVYPSDEEVTGSVVVGWRGPKLLEDNRQFLAIYILFHYLCDTSVSLLQREFVEIDDPLASNVVFNCEEFPESMLELNFTSVPIDKLKEVLPKLQKLFKEIVNKSDGIDMARIKMVIEKQILNNLSALESDPHYAIAALCENSVVLGKTQSDFDIQFNINRDFEHLLTMQSTFWQEIIKNFFIDAPYVAIQAIPSIEEQDKIAKNELERLEVQRASLGVTGLAMKGDALAKAIATNDIEPPSEMLTKIPIPSTDSIKFHPVEECAKGFDLKSLPVFVEAYDAHTNFVDMAITINTDSVDNKFRPYLLLLLELLCESPVRCDGKLIPYETVVSAIEQDTIDIGHYLGFFRRNHFDCGPYSNTIVLFIQVEMSKYSKGVEWLHKLLWQTEFTVDRIRVCASKMVNDVPAAKQEGQSIVSALMNSLFYAKDSNIRASSILNQQKFLNSILQRLNNPESADSVIADLNELRGLLTNLSNIGVHIGTNWKGLMAQNKDLVTPWTSFLGASDQKDHELKVTPDHLLMEFKASEFAGEIVGLGCVESGFLYHAVPSINDYMDADLPALKLFANYLGQAEGPMWKRIRGPGFTYCYSMHINPTDGLLKLALYRATNVIDGFNEMKAIINEQLSDNAIWDLTLIESAKSSLIFEVIDDETNVNDVIRQSFMSPFKRTPQDYNRLMIKKINAVTVNDLIQVGKKYVSALFTDKARTTIVCHTDKASAISSEFKKHNLNMKMSLSVDTCGLNCN